MKNTIIFIKLLYYRRWGGVGVRVVDKTEFYALLRFAWYNDISPIHSSICDQSIFNEKAPKKFSDKMPLTEGTLLEIILSYMKKSHKTFNGVHENFLCPDQFIHS